MSIDPGSSVPPIALAYYWMLLPGLLTWGARMVMRESELPRNGTYRVRRHLMSVLARALAGALVAAVVGVGVWVLADDAARGRTLLWGGAVFVGFGLLASGVLAVALRVSLHLVARMEAGESPRPLLGLLAGGLVLTGALYGWAVLRYGSPRPAETLIALHALGGALIGLGLNRSDELEPDRFARLGRALRG